MALQPLLCRAQENKLAVAPAESVVVKRGAEATADLRVTILSGFHVNSDKPKDEFLIPLRLTWNDGPLRANSILYPKPEEVRVGAETLAVFSGSFDVKTNFSAPANSAAGNATMTGKLRYQACNSQMCFRPATIEVAVPVVIE